MCGSELTPKPTGLSDSDRSLLRQARRVAAADGVCPSPCISVCRMSDDTGWCAGCWRSLDEIAAWGAATTEFRRAVWQRIAERLQSASPT